MHIIANTKVIGAAKKNDNNLYSANMFYFVNYLGNFKNFTCIMLHLIEQLKVFY